MSEAHRELLYGALQQEFGARKITTSQHGTDYFVVYPSIKIYDCTSPAETHHSCFVCIVYYYDKKPRLITTRCKSETLYHLVRCIGNISCNLEKWIIDNDSAVKGTELLDIPRIMTTGPLN